MTVAFPSFPTITMEMINHSYFPKADLSSLKRINNVAPPELLRNFQEAFPQAVQTGAYGLTEAGGVIAYNHPEDSLEKRINTCGKPMRAFSKDLDPETLEEKSAERKVKSILKGYSVFDGYYKAPEKNEESLLMVGSEQEI